MTIITQYFNTTKCTHSNLYGGDCPYLRRFPSKHNNILNSQLQCTYDISRFRVRFDDPMVENKELRVEKLKKWNWRRMMLTASLMIMWDNEGD